MNKRARGLHDDPLSAASAGLLALGIDRHRRAEALELLAAMIDLADDDGAVLLDGALFAVEQRMGVEDCLEIYGWLEQLDVVRRTSEGWAIADFAAHNGPAGETLASLDVLRRHLDSVGMEDPVPLVAAVETPAAVDAAPVVALRKWRRAVPMAAVGVAASVAIVTGVSQFIPQAAVSGRNVANQAAVPGKTSTTLSQAVQRALENSRRPVATPSTDPTVSSTIPGLGLTPTTDGGLVSNAVDGVACAVPKIVNTVTSVDLVRLPLAGDKGQSIWAAVVTGTTTLTDASTGILLPALEVVAHLADGDTDPVLATLTAPLLLPDVPMPFSAVVALGTTKPTSTVTASAAASGLKGC